MTCTHIVLISSVGAELGIPGQVAYGASKAGLVGMARTLAAEWAPRGVRCNVVMPGMIATPKVRAMPGELQVERERLAARGTGADDVDARRGGDGLLHLCERVGRRHLCDAVVLGAFFPAAAGE